MRLTVDHRRPRALVADDPLQDVGAHVLCPLVATTLDA
jgi:hypothetical protein